MPKSVELDTVIADPRWSDAVPDLETAAAEAVPAALNAAGFDSGASLCLLLTDDDQVRTLNREYRGKDAPTNVLSFPTEEGVTIPGAAQMLGDIALAFETTSREAQESGKTLRNHALHLIVHGSLHLIGYTHGVDTEAEAMESLEIEVLARLGVPDPYRTGDEDWTERETL